MTGGETSAAGSGGHAGNGQAGNGQAGRAEAGRANEAGTTGDNLAGTAGI